MKKHIIIILFLLPIFISNSFAQTQPKEFDIFYAEALVLYETGNYNQAIDKLTFAISKNGNKHYYYLKRGDAFYAQKRYNNAKADYLNAEKISKETALLGIARCYAMLKKQDKAITYLEKYLNQKKKLSLANIKLDPAFNTLSQSKKWNNLLKQNHYKKNDIKLDRAEYLIKMDKTTDAINIINELLSHYKKNSRAYNLRGDIFFAKKQYRKAVKDYSKAIDYDKKTLLYYQKRAFAYIETEKYERAAKDYEHIILSAPNSINYFFYKANAEFKAKNYNTANENINMYIKYYNKDIKAYFLKALILQKQNDNFEALQILNKCIEADQSEYKYFKARAISHSSAGMEYKAEKDLSMALDLHPTGELYYMRAKIRQQLGNMNTACNDIKMAEHYGYYKASDLRNSSCQ